MREETDKNIYALRLALGIKRYAGLMFQQKPEPLMFKFETPTIVPIHSFFCKPFYALWLRDGKIIEARLIQPNLDNIKPSEKFDMLIEIPIRCLQSNQ